MSLSDFLMARISEDETAARAALEAGSGGDKWDVDGTDDLEVWANAEWEVDASGEDGYGTNAGVFIAGGDVVAAGVEGTAVVEHIARWDPARVLAEAQGKRQILAMHHMATQTAAQSPSKTAHFSAVASALESAMLFLAMAYADHPHHQPEWKR